jgi:hypothetical protein
VASVSYSGAGSSTINTTGTYCRNNGALLIWAAGNDGATLNGNREDDVIYVGATTSNDGLAGFYNRGSLIDLVAPGQSVYTTSNSGNNSYGSASGTSFSCPLAAGACGLIFSADPTLTPVEVENILRAGCDDLGSSGVDNIYGYGRIDIGNSLAMVNVCDATSYCTSGPNSSGQSSTINFSGTTSVAANDFGVFSSGNPSNQNGIFYMGVNQTNFAFGNGRQCVSYRNHDHAARRRHRSLVQQSTHPLLRGHSRRRRQRSRVGCTWRGAQSIGSHRLERKHH